MPRFVLLRHECPPDYGKPSHWDFMLAWGDVLRTWELRQLPASWARALGLDAEAAAVEAIPLPDHRREYLDFEGPLSNDRGHVARCDSGTYELLAESARLLEVRLEGELLRGVVRLIREEQRWTIDPT